MRGYYLHPTDYNRNGGCRGGVGDSYMDSNDYELEIGNTCNCSSK